MVKSAERTALELKSLENNDKLISGFDDLVVIWKFLIRNISFDFTNKTIDYYSLLRTFNEASTLVKTDSFSNGPSLRISKRYALLWFYLRHIYNTDCNEIFSIYHHHKILIIYLVMELFWTRACSYGINELYPRTIVYLFEKIYENVPQKLEHIMKLVREYNLEHYRNLLGIYRKNSNYIELARFIIGSSREYCPYTTWKIRALAELESYLTQHGRKVVYSTK